ncbi:MAG: hypothetical protein JJU10_00240 [Idiomarina sp.]|nr:hypothetical protein [Idiomarina sp.]MCH8479187.1 hypothetical protein [Wenzhouxiangella sp.]
MKTFEFSLRFDVASCGLELHELDDKLFSAGCDDALIRHNRQGEVLIEYERAATTALEALEQAKQEVISGVPGAVFLEAKPDYVSPTDIAMAYQITRQRVQKIIQTKGIGIHPLTNVGNTQVFRLAKVMEEFRKVGTPICNPALYEAATAALKLNRDIELRDYY